MFSRLSLQWRIYLLLVAILFPVFLLTILVQIHMTKPALQEEVRQLGFSICRSLSTEIVAFRLLNSPQQLENRLVRLSWSQPNLVRLEVLTREGEKIKTVASNIVDETPPEFSHLPKDENPVAKIESEEDREFWDIYYPIQDRRKTVGYLHAEVSLQLVDRIVDTFTRIALVGAALAIGLLMLLLSYSLRRMIENERKLRKVESLNVELTEQLHDVQRQVFLNEKLAIMGQLTASFAHEIGTPLNSVSGHLQLLKDDVVNEASRSRLEIINSQLTRIESIVKNFLASTHMPSQQKDMVDVKTFIEKIVKLVSPRLQALNVRLQIVVAADVDPIRMVPSELEQVLINLTNNALDALEARASGGRELTYTVRVRRSSESKLLEIDVVDTGEGIPQSELKQVLKPFFTTKPAGKGTGLGLTISQGFVRKYGGRIDLQSEVGKGTTVKVSIPYGVVEA